MKKLSPMNCLIAILVTSSPVSSKENVFQSVVGNWKFDQAKSAQLADRKYRSPITFIYPTRVADFQVKVAFDSSSFDDSKAKAHGEDNRLLNLDGRKMTGNEISRKRPSRSLRCW